MKLGRPPSQIGCSVNKCIREHSGKGFCAVHYRRFKRGSDLNKPIQIKGNGYLNVQGYRIIHVNGSAILEHRHIVQKHISRKLRKDEVVHHKNKIKTDNTIENLEIMSRDQHMSHHHPEVIMNCSIKECSKISHGQRYCRNHKRAFSNHGNPLIRLRSKKGEFVPCSVDKCPNRLAAKKLCFAHYTRILRESLGKKPRLDRRILP